MFKQNQTKVTYYSDQKQVCKSTSNYCPESKLTWNWLD